MTRELPPGARWVAPWEDSGEGRSCDPDASPSTGGWPFPFAAPSWREVAFDDGRPNLGVELIRAETGWRVVAPWVDWMLAAATFDEAKAEAEERIATLLRRRSSGVLRLRCRPAKKAR